MNIFKQFLKLSSALALIVAFSGVFTACDDKDDEVKTFKVRVQLVYPEGYTATQGVKVTLTNTSTSVLFEEESNSAGIAEFSVVAGSYEASASESRTEGFSTVLFNGIKSNILVTDAWVDTAVELPLTQSKSSNLVIKELYNGGCQKSDGTGSFIMDQYVILYNNSEVSVPLKNLCIGYCLPGNAHANNSFLSNDELIYKNEGWIPAGYGIWALEQEVNLDPGKQIVISFDNSIDNTLVNTNSINFANPDYYACFDIAVWTNTTYYKVSEVIPTSHYLKGYKLAGVSSNALSMSVSSPAFFLFQPEDQAPSRFASNADNTVLHGTSASQNCLKVPVEWIVDGLEVYQKGQANSRKRLTDAVDAGYIELTNNQGYTLYRNVNKELTEAIAENAGKLVYSYSLGTDGSTDSSGIDAEASIKNGARIIYKDTNNSTADFHQRSKASLRN